MEPWYRGYTGKIEYAETSNAYTFHGAYRFRDDNCLEINELPVGKWTADYKGFLEGLLKNDELDDVKEYHKDNTVSFVLKGSNLRNFENTEGGISKKFKLTTSVSLNNFVLFDSKQRIKKYANEVEIIEEFFPIRLELY